MVTNGRVVVPGCVAKKRIITQEGISNRAATVFTNRFRVWRKRKASESEWNEQRSERVM
jgi:hypothetical protein